MLDLGVLAIVLLAPQLGFIHRLEVAEQLLVLGQPYPWQPKERTI